MSKAKTKKKLYRLKLASGGYIALTYYEICASLGFSEGAGITVTTQNTISFKTMSFADIVRLYDRVIEHGFVPSLALKKYADNCKAVGIGQEEV
ncbi:MAG: hypothetical protein LUG23_00270 [Oscillospiraceae bacterium]|nr:hypothetical protein [Oscillospiraceae bacterium]